MRYLDICTKRVYKAKDGSEKTAWLKCGTLKIMDNGKTFIELNHLPGVGFYCFPQNKKEDAVAVNEFAG